MVPTTGTALPTIRLPQPHHLFLLHQHRASLLHLPISSHSTAAMGTVATATQPIPYQPPKQQQHRKTQPNSPTNEHNDEPPATNPPGDEYPQWRAPPATNTRALAMPSKLRFAGLFFISCQLAGESARNWAQTLVSIV